MTKCECCKTNDVNETKHFCKNCFYWTNNTTWGNIWFMVCSYHAKHEDDKFVSKIIELAFKEDGRC